MPLQKNHSESSLLCFFSLSSVLLVLFQLSQVPVHSLFSFPKLVFFSSQKTPSRSLLTPLKKKWLPHRLKCSLPPSAPFFYHSCFSSKPLPNGPWISPPNPGEHPLHSSLTAPAGLKRKALLLGQNEGSTVELAFFVNTLATGQTQENEIKV